MIHLLDKMIRLKQSLFVISISLIICGQCTLSPSKNKKSSVRLGAVDNSVHDRNLIIENPSAKDILNNYKSYYTNTTKYNVDGIVLGYVTPVSYLYVIV